MSGVNPGIGSIRPYPSNPAASLIRVIRPLLRSSVAELYLLSSMLGCSIAEAFCRSSPGDAVGRKLVYTNGFVVFTVASAACGLAPSLDLLILLRLVQALGAAMLQANSVALVTTSAPKHRMRFALGIQAGAQSLGLALGPTLGGLLTSTAGWRAVYWVNVPVGVVAVVTGRYLLPRTRQFNRPERFDWPGTLLLVAWTSALLVVLSAAAGLSLPAWTAAVLVALALAGLTAFIRREVTTRHPLIPV